MKPPLPVAVFDTLHELQHLFRARMRSSMQAVHPELTLNEMRILMRTGHRPGITQRELVEHSHADKAQMARLLARLQQRGWLTRSRGDGDRRVRCLHLSARGRRLFAQLRRLQEQVAGELLQDCPPSAQARLLGLLQQARHGATARAGIPAAHPG